MKIHSYRVHHSLPLALLASCLLAAQGWAAPVDEALPMVGTSGHGHTYPGATLPFGFVQVSPDTRTTTWDSCSGYYYADSTLFGFSHTHLSGTGAPDMGDILILPFTGGMSTSGAYKPLAAARLQSKFSHDREIAEPGYYRVSLDTYQILAELTATAHTAMHRYTFLASEEGHILVDLVHGIRAKSAVEASLNIESKTVVSGFRRSTGWAKDKTIYFVIESSQPFNAAGLESDGQPLPGDQTEGKNLRAHLDYKTAAGQQIVLRVGLSPTSVAEAKKNLQAEITGWDFDAVRAAARANWNANLSHITIESPNPNIRQTFYSALYHTLIAPTLYNDADGSYPGPDKKVHSGDFQYYSTFSTWDTFRAEHPLLTIIQPERVNDFVQSMLAFYQESPDHALPMWPLASTETWCMIGYHAVPIILDAYQKGFRGFDAELAYQAMTNTALSGRNRQDEYQQLGYVPWVSGKTEATSQTLEFAYDDWCIAQMAKALGKTEDAERFTKRSQNYRNVWDPATKFFRSKNPDGTFHEPFDPKEVATGDATAAGSYTEANAWQYMFAVSHNVSAMIQLYGGNEGFIKRLDEFFNEDSDMPHWRIDVSGLIGQYAHGNEPDQQAPYLYALAGAQYKTAYRVHQIMLTQYDNTPAGICGNDDCGQISAWYVWSAMGLYPVNPADGKYVIGSPLVEKATINLDPKFYPGGTFTIVAHNVNNQNIYVQSAKLNGQPLDRAWITHEEITKGGTLELEMDILPNKNWPVRQGK